MPGILVVKFSNLPTYYGFAPYFIVLDSTEGALLNGRYATFGKPLVMWECEDLDDAQQWAMYLNSKEK